MTENDDRLKLGLEIATVGSRLWFMIGLQAAFVKDAAMRPFYNEAKQQFFWNNPENTLAYMGLDALEESCIVHICEFIEREFPDMTGDVPFRRAADLLAHRASISHPGRKHWRKAWMSKFHDDDRHYLDLRAAIIWDLQKSLDELTADSSFSLPRPELHVTLEMVATLEQIWKFSMNPEGLKHLPAAADLYAQLKEAAPNYIDMLERHPSGRVADTDSEDGAGGTA